MVVDMQEWFLRNWFNSKSNVSKLIENTSKRVFDAMKKGKKIFVVEFEWYWELIPEIKQVLNWDCIKVLKERDYFLLLERKGLRYWLYHWEIDGIESMELAWVHTNFCVREAYRVFYEQWISCWLKLGSTLNLCNLGTSLEYVTRHYVDKNRISPVFIWREKWKPLLEDYL